MTTYMCQTDAHSLCGHGTGYTRCECSCHQKARGTKRPVVGIVSYVSKNGAEIRLADDEKRYRGIQLRSKRHAPSTGTLDIGRGIVPGQTVRLHWGGFANMNITAVDVLDS